MTAVEDWLASGQPALIAGHSLRPRMHPALPVPLQMTLGQASTYWLEGDDGTWFLKSFLPARRPQRRYVEDIAHCIPRLPAFRCGWERWVLSPADLARAPGTFTSAELAAWLDGTVLMPQHRGEAWGEVLTGIAEGQSRISDGERIAIARQLTEAILIMELLEASHRDISSGNVLVDFGREPVVSLIDWDTLYHPILSFQTNTMIGTAGYVPPWLAGDGQRSWHPHADRFALAICVAEILTVRPGMRLYGEGSLFDQQQLGADPEALRRTNAALAVFAPALAVIFEQAWTARSFEECPSPIDWLKALDNVLADDQQGDTRAQRDLATYKRWRTALTSVRSALREAETIDIEAVIGQHPGLERLLTPGLERLFARDRAVAQALVALRQALARGEDAEIVRTARADELDHQRLRASELLHVEQARGRVRTLAVLQEAVAAKPSDDEAVVDAWWGALRAGCTIPQALTDAAQAARQRQNSERKAPGGANGAGNLEAAQDPSTPEFTPPLAQAPPPPTARDAAESQRLTALGMLDAAMARGDASTIAAAATAVRVAGGRIPALAWDAVARAEARVAGLEALRAALQKGDLERSALAWARANVLWPDGIAPDQAAAGEEAFRRWGRVAKAEESGAVGNES